MQVIAFSTPARPEWRWRILDYSGEMVQESYGVFATIAAAIADGTTRLVEMNTADVPASASASGWTFHRRS